MTQELEKRIRTRFDHQQARILLKETYKAKMLFAYNGGMWVAGPDLINICTACPGTIVLEDHYETPISVSSKDLCELATQRWQEQMNAWQSEYNEICNLR